MTSAAASRRGFLGMLAGSGMATLNSRALARSLDFITRFQPEASARDIAADESFWLTIQQAFDVDRSIINLNNGGVSPAPRVVIEAVRQYMDYTNQAPAYTLWRHLEPNVENVRERVAHMFGVEGEEIALTRNASESLEIVQLGLNLKAGDEVVTTTQDYPRMLTTWEQRSRRDGVVIKKVDYPTPLLNPNDYVQAISNAISAKTRVIHVSHVCFMTGQILPVQRIAALARSKNIECIVDGAHAFAQFPFRYADIGCDYYGCSLHKWLHGPLGTGFLFVRKEKIKDVWALMAAPADMDNNIRKFEEIGTHPASLHNALGAAVMFNESLGLERKAARLRYLHHRWIDRLKNYPNVKFMSDINDERNWCGIMVVNIEGTDINKVQSHLFDKYRIFTVGITHAQFKGLRITPSSYTRASDIDLFADVMENIAKGKVADLMEK